MVGKLCDVVYFVTSDSILGVIVLVPCALCRRAPGSGRAPARTALGFVFLSRIAELEHGRFVGARHGLGARLRPC